MNEKQSEKKPLSFSTTMRNPERIVDFLKCILPFEGEKLTHELIMRIIAELIKEQLYKPMVVNREQDLLVVYKDEEQIFSNDQIEYIIEMSPQDHKERGFDWGWDSRFDTLYKLPMELGFIKYGMNEPIKISSAGHMLIEAIGENEERENKLRAVFLNSMAKYQSDNPYRKNANANNPLGLLLRVLRILKNDPNANGAGVYRKELSLFICWPDNDAHSLYNKIKQIREEKGFTYSDEYIYEICLELLDATDKRNRFKMSQICGEAVDEYIRKMRTTGTISLRGNGRFIDYNDFEINKINYIIDKYSDHKDFKNKDDYYDYVGKIDYQIINTPKEIPENVSGLKQNSLIKYADEYSKDTIFKELKMLCNRRASKDPLLKLLPNPVRLEFLTSIALIQNMNNITVEPNYAIDDEGLPTNTASGGKADIVCSDNNIRMIVEVTLMCDKYGQVTNEILPIRRHLIDIKKECEGAFAVLVAPSIHEDAEKMSQWLKHSENLDIFTYDINELLDKIKKVDTLIEMKKEEL